MNFAVGIVALMVMATFGEVAGKPKEQQLLVNGHNKILDQSSISKSEPLERLTKSIKKKKTKGPCKWLHGKCEHKLHECHGGYGWRYEGEEYCKFHEHYDCCVPPPPVGCVFGDQSYPHTAFLKQSCIRFICLDGLWHIKSNNTDENCATCSIGPGSYIEPFDGTPYTKYQEGTFTLARNIASHPQEFVEVYLQNCTINGDDNNTCVEFVYYHDFGIDVKIKPGDLTTGDDGYVKVDGQEVILPSGADVLYATEGAILIYKESNFNYYIISPTGLSINIERYLNSNGDTITDVTVYAKDDDNYNFDLCNPFLRSLVGYSTISQ